MAFSQPISGQSATGDGDAVPVDNLEGESVVLEVVIGNTATVTFKARVRDGGTLYTIQATDLNDGTTSTTASASGVFRIDATGLYEIVPDVTAHTSGDVDVYARTVDN